MADKRFNLVFDLEANIKPIKAAVSELEKAFSGIKLPQNLETSISKTLSKVSKEIGNFESLSLDGFTNISDLTKAEKSFERIVDGLRELRLQASKTLGLEPEKLIPKKALDSITELNKIWNKLKIKPAQTGGC